MKKEQDRGGGSVGVGGKQQVLGEVPSKQLPLWKTHSDAEWFRSGRNPCSILTSFSVVIAKALIGINVIMIIIIEILLLLLLL